MRAPWHSAAIDCFDDERLSVSRIHNVGGYIHREDTMHFFFTLPLDVGCLFLLSLLSRFQFPVPLYPISPYFCSGGLFFLMMMVSMYCCKNSLAASFLVTGHIRVRG